METTVTGKLVRLYNGVNKVIARHLVPRIVPIRNDAGIEVFGKAEGTWHLPRGAVRPGIVCYCVGVGREATLDVQLAERGCEVYSFDPTPTAIAYMETLDYPKDRLTFKNVGVWKTNTTLKFYMPADGIVNLSVRDIHGTGVSVEAECKTLTTIMGELGHSHIDILKIDVEGAWPEIIDSMLAENVSVGVLAVEFDTPTSTSKVMNYIRRLDAAGFDLSHIERDNYTFQRRNPTA